MVRNEKGFTLVEVVVTVVIGAIIVMSATLAYLKYLPDHELKNAANQLYLDLMDAQSRAITELADITVTFNQANNSYTITNDSTNQDIKTVDLTNYGYGVCYGSGPATVTATTSQFNGDFISYSSDSTTFEPDGTVSNLGYVYITNQKQNICYAISTSSRAGLIRIKKTGAETWP